VFQTLELKLPVVDHDKETISEIGSKKVSITNNFTYGIRVILGEAFDDLAPDVLIERHRDHWLIIIHPVGGNDPICGVEIYKDRTTVSDCGGKLLAMEEYDE